MKIGWKKNRISAVCLEMEIQDIIIEEKDTIMYNIRDEQNTLIQK